MAHDGLEPAQRHRRRVSGALSPTPTGVTGALRLSGSGTLAGRVRVQLSASGRGRAAGTLGGRAYDLTFRIA